jgi:hypothetical protein
LFGSGEVAVDQNEISSGFSESESGGFSESLGGS